MSTPALPVPPALPDHSAAPPAARPTRRSRKPPWRRTLLVLHVAVSVGWLGVSAVFVLLTVWLRGVRDPATLRVGYEVHEIAVLWLAQPAAIGTAVTGIPLILVAAWARPPGPGRWRGWVWWVPAKTALVVATVLVTAPTSPQLLRFVVEAPQLVSTPAYTSAQDQLIALAVLHVVAIVIALVLSTLRPRRLRGRSRS